MPFIWFGLRGQAPPHMQFWGSANIFPGVFVDTYKCLPNSSENICAHGGFRRSG